MIVSTGFGDLPLPGEREAVVSIGVFDGVHLGHEEILAATVRHAADLGALPTVVTFRRHPKRLLLGRAPRTLTTLEHRLELFRRAGIEHCLVLTFDEDLRDMSAEDFTRRVLVGKLRAESFVLGFDSKFGLGREGGPDLLRSLGFDVRVVPEVLVDRRPVSSTAIREAVELGDLGGAQRMLGRPVSVYGEVVHGSGLGRGLGFPTANLDLHHELHPPAGVYACRVRILRPGEDRALAPLLPAVANIGWRPTLAKPGPPEAGADQPVVEAHLIDFSEDLYGLHLELLFVAALRPEQRFEGLEALREQIARDVDRAREILL